MLRKIIKLLFIFHLASAMANDDISIPLPKIAIYTEPQIAKFNLDGEKLFIGFVGEKLSNSIVYDINNKSEIEHCTSKINGDLAALSNDGKQLAVRIKSKKTDKFKFEIINIEKCSLAINFLQPKLQYPELLPKFVFDTHFNRAVFVEARNPYSSGKAFFKSKKELLRNGFSIEDGRVLFFDLNKKFVFNQTPTPSDFTTPYLDDSGQKLILMQETESYSERISYFSTIDGKKIQPPKDSQLSDLQSSADGSPQFCVDYFTSGEIYATNDIDTPTIDEKNENITFRTTKGERQVSNITPVRGEKFWLPVNDGKYVVFVGHEITGHFINMYVIQKN